MTKVETSAFEIPDFDKFAASYDRFLYLIEPVSETIFSRMPAHLSARKILDVACGTGEPGLTLARRNPSANILGIDAAGNMISIASQKSLDSELQNINFQVMSAEKMTLSDAQFDGIISRFGLGMFGDTQRSAKEAFRVLKTEGFFVIAVWHDLAKNTFLKTMMEAANEIVSVEETISGTLPGFEAEALFRAAGFDISVSEFAWNYHFNNEDDLRTMVATAAAQMLRPRFAAINDQSKTEEAYSKIMERFARYKTCDGIYEIPHTCLVLQGKKPTKTA